jgi:hypothetical protein
MTGIEYYLQSGRQGQAMEGQNQRFIFNEMRSLKTTCLAPSWDNTNYGLMGIPGPLSLTGKTAAKKFFKTAANTNARILEKDGAPRSGMIMNSCL